RVCDGTAAVLVVAAERACPDLSLEERIRRLIAGGDAPLAAFSGDGTLIAATDSACPRLRGATSLTALGADTLAAAARASGHAAGHIRVGASADPTEGSTEDSINRVGEGDATALVASIGAPPGAPGAWRLPSGWLPRSGPAGGSPQRPPRGLSRAPRS